LIGNGNIQRDEVDGAGETRRLIRFLRKIRSSRQKRDDNRNAKLPTIHFRFDTAARLLGAFSI
jgi:hypothetical protein